MIQYRGIAAAELLWLKAQIITGPAPYSGDAVTPFGYRVVGLRDQSEFMRVLPYVHKRMLETKDLARENADLIKRIAELEAEKAEPSLKVINGEICYKSKQDDQSFGMRCPVGTWCPVNYDSEHGLAEGTKFYTASPREWVGLTHEEVNSWELPDTPTVFEFTKFIEAKLKEKNHIASIGKMVALEKENEEIKKQLEQTQMALREQVQLKKYLEKRLSANT